MPEPRKRPPARRPPKPPVASDDRLDLLIAAVVGLTEATTTQTARLEATEQASRDTAVWRRKATRRGTAIVVIVSLAIAAVGYTTVHADRQDAKSSLRGCQERNGGQAVTRGIFTDTYDVIERPPSPIPAGALDPLRQQVNAARKYDRDCDGDGRIDAGDFTSEDRTVAGFP